MSVPASAIAARYAAAASACPSPIVAPNHAVPVAIGPAAGSALIERLDADGRVAGCPLLPAARADLLRRLA